MSIIRVHAVTSASPEQFVAGLTDFGPGRRELFANSDDERLVVHERGGNWADVTEGAGGVWERLRYDWSDPRRITMRTVDSNVWGGGSGHTYTLSPRPDGTTAVDAVVVREGKNLKGKLIGLLLGSVGKGTLTKAFERSVKAIEGRDYPASATGSPR
jgi:hypothetical protein